MDFQEELIVHTYLQLYLGEKKLQEKWSKLGLYLMSKDELLRFSKFFNEGFKRSQLNCASRSANRGQIGWHWLAGNSLIPHWKILKISITHP